MDRHRTAMTAIIKLSVLIGVGLLVSVLIMYIRNTLLVNLFTLILSVLVLLLTIIVYVFYDYIDILQKQVTSLDLFRISENKRMDKLETKWARKSLDYKHLKYNRNKKKETL